MGPESPGAGGPLGVVNTGCRPSGPRPHRRCCWRGIKLKWGRNNRDKVKRRFQIEVYKGHRDSRCQKAAGMFCSSRVYTCEETKPISKNSKKLVSHKNKQGYQEQIPYKITAERRSSRTPALQKRKARQKENSKRAQLLPNKQTRQTRYNVWWQGPRKTKPKEGKRENSKNCN